MDNTTFHNAQHLSLEELIEYSKGNLSNAEMHRLELHLISCELCNDALEGVQQLSVSEAEKSLAKILETNSLNNKSALGLYHYIGIAASVMLIAIVGYFFMRSGDPEQLAATDQQESLNEQAYPKKHDSLPGYAIVDSLETATDTTMLAFNETNDQAQTSQLSENSRQATGAPASDTTTKPVVAAAEYREAVTQPPATMDDTNAIAAISVSDSLPATETLAGEQAMAKRAAVPQEGAPSLTEQANEETIAAVFVKAEPPKGEKAFARYLKKNVIYPDEAKANNITGDVLLEVEINSDGNIGAIRIAKSLGYGCDEEALRLVREGGNWSPALRDNRAVTDTVSITVSFKP